MSQLVAIVAFAILLSACGGPGEPFERVEKLRAIGVNASPLVALPSTEAKPSVVNLIFHLLVPVGQTITAEAFVDEKSQYSSPVRVNLNQSSDDYKDYTSLRHYTIAAKMPIPNQEELRFSDENKAARLQYAVSFRSGGEEEKVVGTVFVQRSEDIETFKSLKIAIKKPLGSDKIGRKKEIDIEAAISNPNREPVKVGWFVSGGRLENRRARKTKWETGKADKQLLIATIRGKRSRSFDIDFIELGSE